MKCDQHLFVPLGCRKGVKVSQRSSTPDAQLELLGTNSWRMFLLANSFAYVRIRYTKNKLVMSKIANPELSEQAYKKVKAMIISRKLVPGQKIVQDKLAESLGISRTPLRSALQMLEGESLIESVPRKGVIVKEFNDEEIVEIYDCRMALEGTAMRLYTNLAPTYEIKRLRALFQPFLKGAINLAKYQIADSKFHASIVHGCGNNFLSKLFQQGNLLVFIDIIGLVRPPEETINEHLEIIAAIEARDPDLAESLAKAHLNKSKELILERINER